MTKKNSKLMTICCKIAGVSTAHYRGRHPTSPSSGTNGFVGRFDDDETDVNLRLVSSNLMSACFDLELNRIS